MHTSKSYPPTHLIPKYALHLPKMWALKPQGGVNCIGPPMYCPINTMHIYASQVHTCMHRICTHIQYMYLHNSLYCSNLLVVMYIIYVCSYGNWMSTRK